MRDGYCVKVSDSVTFFSVLVNRCGFSKFGFSTGHVGTDVAAVFTWNALVPGFSLWLPVNTGTDTAVTCLV